MIDALAYLTDSQHIGFDAIAALVSLLASYTAFSLAVKPAPAERIRYPWLIAAGVATGSGAWATNLIMLIGFQSGIPFAFNIFPIAMALVLGIVGTTVGIFIARSRDQMHLGGLVVGIAIVGVFYAGVQGIEFGALKSWNLFYLAIAAVLGMSCGAAALARGHLSRDICGRIVSTVILAAGITGSNLFGLAALKLFPDPTIIVPSGTALPVLFGISLTAVIMLIIGLGVVGTLVDRYVDEIEAARDLLEVRVAERTAALLTEKHRAESAVRAKSEFLASMSHELRTPLNAILGFSDMIAHASIGPISPRYMEYGEDINKSGQHLLALVNDVLDLSKLESGKFELFEEATNIGGVMDACRSMLIGLAKDAGVDLTMDVAPGLPLVWADPLRIKQIVVNLLSNAIKYTGPGGHVTAMARQTSNGGILIEIQDNGVGMHAEDIERALEPFGQIDNKINRKNRGTGLGLPVVKHLIELHGGDLSILSWPTAGTIVSVYFPGERVGSVEEAVHQARAV